MFRSFDRAVFKSVFAFGNGVASAFTAQAQVLGEPLESNQFKNSRADTLDVSLQVLSAQSIHDPLQLKHADTVVQNAEVDKQVVASAPHNGRFKKIADRNHDRCHHMRERGHRNERNHDGGERHHR